MAESKLYARREGKILIVAAEGVSTSFRDIEKYKELGRYKQADIGPAVLGRNSGEDFVSANVYGNPFSSLTAFHDRGTHEASVVSVGNGNLPLDFLVDVAGIIGLKGRPPSEELIREAELCQGPLISFFEKASRAVGEKAAAELWCLGLKGQQIRYHGDSRIEGARFS